MHTFRPLNISDKEVIDHHVTMLPLFKQYKSSELIFENLYAWANDECIEIMWLDDIGYIRCQKHDELWLFPPIASSHEDFVKGIMYIKDHFKHARIIGITEAMKDLIEDQDALCLIDDKLREYIYDTTSFIELKGSLYHRKRNLIAQFEKKYHYDVKPYEKGDINQVNAFIDHYVKMGGASDDLHAFYKTLHQSIHDDNYKTLLLFVDNHIEGISIGIIGKNNVGITLFEKANSQIQGAYQFLANAFAKTYYKDTHYISRQEDVGIPELRKAKLSYYPIEKDMKYALYFNRDLKELYQIYLQSFPEDSKPYIDYFFLHHVSKRNVYYHKENNHIVSSFYIRNNIYHIDGTNYEIPLIVGAATHPNYQRQGHMKRLIQNYLDACHNNDVPWVILKTDKPNIYQSLGFKIVYEEKSLDTFNRLENCVLEQTANTKLLHEIYHNTFKDIPHDIRDEAYFTDYLYHLNMEGYEAYIIKHDKEVIGYIIKHDEDVIEYVLSKDVCPIIKNHDTLFHKNITYYYMIYPCMIDITHHKNLTFMNGF